MIKAKYATTLCLVLTLILLTFIAGCSGSTTTTNATSSTTKTTSTTTSTSAFTQEQLKQIMLDAKTAMVKAGTYKINMDLMRKTAFDDKAASAGMSMSANFTFNVPQNQLMMSFNMTNTNPDSGEATLEAEIYVFTDYIYMKLNIPGLGIQWVKTPVNAELLDTFNTNMMKEELDGMELPASIEFIKYENIRGTDCYVLKYTPAESYFRDYAEKNVIDGLKIDWDKVSNISDMFKDMSFTTWIGKDTKYIYKMEISGAVVVSSDFAELAGVSFKKATTDIEQTMEIYDINAAASIVLPAEAENAIELSPEMILGK
jgi:hypothetical protein